MWPRSICCCRPGPAPRRRWTVRSLPIPISRWHTSRAPGYCSFARRCRMLRRRQHALSRSRTASRRASVGTSRRSHCRSTALPVTHWRWSAPTPRNIRGTRSRCRWRSGDDWWFLGYLGWAYIETGEVAKGTRLVERSLAGNRRNAHAAHQRVHGFFEAGDTAGGAGFIENWLTGYDRVGHLHCHLSWHLALFELARGNVERSRAIYLDDIRPSAAQAAPMLVPADSASFLWRWRFYGAAPSLEDEWAEVAAHARRHFPRAGLAFADLHAALAEAATGDEHGLQSRIAGLQSLARDGRLPPGEVAAALCGGVGALGRGDNAEAAQILVSALADLVRIGGSHAQREIFEDSLIVAYMRSGQSAKAAPLLRARLGRRPSTRDETWLALCSGNGNEG